MATRGLVDASIDGFWEAVKMQRPPPQPRSARGCSGGPPSSRIGSHGPATARSSPRRPLKQGAYPSAAAHQQPSEPQHPEFKQASVQLWGREGYNAVAVNGVWNFWKVRSGRLAFRREIELDAAGDDAEEAAGASPRSATEGAAAGVGPGDDEGDEEEGVASSPQRGERRGTGKIRIPLFLFYLPQVDAWVISDAPDASGTVVADCGPVAKHGDMRQHWRVWDGEAWLEDRNIEIEINLGDPAPANLRGLAVTSVLPSVGNLSARSRPAPPMAAPHSARVRGGSHGPLPPRL